MAMEITGSYSNYIANNTNATKRATKRSGKNKTTEEKIDTLANNKDKVQEYYEKLCKKFPGITFNSSGGIKSSSENKIVLNLSGECLKKMASDPAFAEKMENDISGIPTAHKQMYAKAKSDGIKIYGFAVRINADGSMQCSCSGSTRTSGTKQSATIWNTEKKQKNRLEKKREERSVLEEKAEKRRAEKKAQEEKTLNEKIAKQEQERSRLLSSKNNKRQLLQAASIYEANMITETATGNSFVG